MGINTLHRYLIPEPIRHLLSWLSRRLVAFDAFAGKPSIRPFVYGFIGTCLLLTVTLYFSQARYVLMVNKSDSLAGTLYFLDKTRVPGCSDYTAFDMPVEARFFRGSRLIKQVRGCAGDRITTHVRMIFINGREVGLARTKAGNGNYDLYPIAAGVIPDGKVYLKSTHVRSYDSRYESFGLRDISELLGTAYELF
ncbi:MAG: hypothetical protein HKN34_05900 [Gammaproteobacteria bacterium]|nr:hypothetical protein [Gammaproteobacteria bacterium]